MPALPRRHAPSRATVARRPGRTRTGQISNVYYWDSLEALQQLISHPDHRDAKQAQARWLKGYQVVIAQVLRSYGDGGMDHPLAPREPASA